VSLGIYAIHATSTHLAHEQPSRPFQTSTFFYSVNFKSSPYKLFIKIYFREHQGKGEGGEEREGMVWDMHY